MVPSSLMCLKLSAEVTQLSRSREKIAQVHWLHHLNATSISSSCSTPSYSTHSLALPCTQVKAAKFNIAYTAEQLPVGFWGWILFTLMWLKGIRWQILQLGDTTKYLHVEDTTSLSQLVDYIQRRSRRRVWQDSCLHHPPPSSSCLSKNEGFLHAWLLHTHMTGPCGISRHRVSSCC